MAAPNAIPVQQLNHLAGTPATPTIVDISIDSDFEANPFLSPGSRRHPYSDIEGLKQRTGPGRCVIPCQKCAKPGQGLVPWLQNDGVSVEYLEGGMFGWRDDQQTVRNPANAIPAQTNGRTIWVTRRRPKVDRKACPWVLLRLADRNECILLVLPAAVTDVAACFGTTPFDVEATFWSHRDSNCTFDMVRDEFGLHIEASDRRAVMIRGAGTNRHDLLPQAAGLLAVSVGLSRQYRDEQDQLIADLGFYDDGHRWAQDGFAKDHDWPMGHRT